MRGELDDVEARVRRDLAAAAADLRGQLVLCLREFEAFRTGLFQSSRETMNKLMAETQENIRKSTAETAMRIETAAAGNLRQAELMTQMLLRVNQSLGELPLMTKLELPSERLDKQIASLASHIESLVVQLEAVTGKLRRFDGIRRRRWYWLFLR